MNNINVRVVGTANVTQMSGAFGKLEAQVSQLNAQLSQMVALQNGVDPRGYERMSKAAALNSKMFRNAAASTGMFEVQQLKLNRATDDYISNLQKQKLSFREMAAQRKVAASAYKEQLAMQQMVVRQSASSTVHGKQMLDVAYPKEISAQLNTAGQRLMFFNEQLKSGATQMVNWGKNTQWAGRQLMVGFTMPIAAFGAAAGVMAYQVDKELTRIAKVYDTTAKSGMAREKELIAVRQQSMETAIDAARAYGSAGTDTLNVQAELAATGLKGAELQGYTNEVMRISTLGELEYADSIKSAITMQAVFKMSTQELTESFDYMNSVENATSLQTKDFAAAIPIAAAPVKAFGGDIKELGVLLTAMKERGIDASEGANAIKAAMQRLGRPSKQIQKEWKELTDTDITKIFDDSDSLIDLFSRIGDATKNLTNKEQIKAFSGLFGTYQVTRMGALVSGMQDLAMGTGQVSKAAELANASVTDLARTAEQELAQQAESLSGRWDRAFQELKLQLVAVGEPFLEIATVVVKSITMILDAFNGLPKTMKVLIAIGIGLGALAGPVVMLTGLFANLFGNGLKIMAAFMGRMAKLMGATKLMTAEQRAAQLVADGTSTSMRSEASAAEMLTLQLRKLAAAQAMANRVAREQRVESLVAGGMPRSAAYAQLAAERRKDLQNAGLMNGKGESLSVIPNIEKSSARTSQHWKNIGVGMAGAATAGGILLMNSEGTVGQLAQMVLYASLLGPLLTPLGGLLFKGFAGAGGKMTNIFGKMTTSVKAAGSTTGALFKGLKGIGSILGVLARAIGPAGWAIAGLAGIYAIWNKTKQAQEAAAAKHKELLDAQLKAARALNDTQRMFAENTGKSVKELKTLLQVGSVAYGQTPLQQVVEKYKGEAYTGEREAFGDVYKNSVKPADISGYEFGDTEFDQEAIYQFVMLQEELGLTAKQAAKEMNALALASGTTYADADNMVRNLLTSVGDTKKMTHEARLEMLRFFEDRTIYGTFTVDEDGKSLFDPANAEAYVDTYMGYVNAALAKSQNKVQFDSVLAGVQETIDRGYAGMFERLTDAQRTALEGVGVDSIEGYRDFLAIITADTSKMDEQQKAMHDARFSEYTKMYADNPELFGYDNGIFTKGLNDVFDTGEASKFEAIIAQSLADTYNLGDGWTDLASVLADPVFTTQFQPVNQKTIADFTQRVALMRNLLAQPEFSGGADDTVGAREEKRNALLREMSQLLAVNGVETGKVKNIQQALNMLVKLMNGELGVTPSKLGAIAGAASSVAGALRSAFASIDGAGFLSSYQAGMQNVQQGIADDMRASFDSQMNNALESRQAMWDNRVAAVNAANEAAQRGLDAKWEKKREAAEAYWDARVEGVEKAIEAEEKAEEKRQKMFDAEMARITALNDAANQNIDFNVALSEGKFDEAAKIRNDAESKESQTALERAASAGSGKSERRVNTLEGNLASIEKAREKAMKQLEKMEAAERRHLEKISAMRSAAVQKDMEADMAARREDWEARKADLEKQLATFMSFIAANEKQLKQHMKNVGIEYDDFEKDVIIPKGKKWGDYFGEKLRDGMRDAGLKLASDKMWSLLGKGAADELLKGMGFKDMNQFRKFVQTGTFKSDTTNETTETRHEGGMVGDGPGSRKGIARTARAHASEKMIRAQKGEYVVNRKDAARNLDVLESINSGRPMPLDAHGRGRGQGGYTAEGGGGGIMSAVAGLAGWPMAMAASGLIRGTGMAMKSAYTKKKEQIRIMNAAASSGGAYYGAGAGNRNYNVGPVKPWVQEAANYLGNKHGISTIGGYRTGAVDPNGHPAGRALDLMTSSFSQGDALMKTIIGMHGVLDAEYAIWKQRITGGSRPWGVWEGMEDRGSPTANHMDHVHLNFNATGRAGDLPKSAGATGPGGGAVMGGGGRHLPINYPVSRGLHDTTTAYPGVDMATGSTGKPVFAVGDGKILSSYDLAGYEPRNGSEQNGYYSYGKVMTLGLNGGGSVLYAHLSQRNFGAGANVKGGTVIGQSGNTGYSTGPHLHFGASSGNPFQYTSLAKGAANVKWDNTIANLHKGEAVLTEDLNKKFHQGVENFANGGNNTYNVYVDANGTNASADEIAEKVIVKLRREENRKPRSRRG